ncbi:MAG: hypothetical protein ACC707_14970, partial [Thiohalomonadales bacterium]
MVVRNTPPTAFHVGTKNVPTSQSRYQHQNINVISCSAIKFSPIEIMVFWCFGAMVLWCYGAMVLWC